jgi:glycosyltransferase involved in cell wall biosynthesis
MAAALIMDISVIISTWNNAKLLNETLEGLTRLTPPQGTQWELIVVDNNCTDDTPAVVERFLKRLPLISIKEPISGKSRGLNCGLKKAKGKFIIFTDDDVVPCTQWLAFYWQTYLEKPCGFYFGGPIESKFEALNFDRDLLTIAPESVKGFDLGEDAKIVPPDQYFLGANWACPADILKEIGGFDVTQGPDPSTGQVKAGEETDLMKRLRRTGFKGYYIAQAKIQHFVPLEKCTLKHIGARWEVWGQSLAENYDENLKKDQLLFGVPRWMYRLLVEKYSEWFIKKMSGQKAYPQYSSYREHLGLMQGLQKRYRYLINTSGL